MLVKGLALITVEVDVNVLICEMNAVRGENLPILPLVTLSSKERRISTTDSDSGSLTLNMTAKDTISTNYDNGL